MSEVQAAPILDRNGVLITPGSYIIYTPCRGSIRYGMVLAVYSRFRVSIVNSRRGKSTLQRPGSAAVTTDVPPAIKAKLDEGVACSKCGR